eukprot:11217647-Ditylum_brightwellii.AAC.1
MEYLAEYVPKMQDDFIKEQRKKEFEATQIRMRKEAGHINIESTIEAQYDAYENDEIDNKKLGRRQRAKLKAAEKAYNRDDVLAQEEEERKMKQAVRIEKAQAGMQFHRVTMAHRAIEKRERENVKEEAENAARAAMNAAFNR